MSEASARARLSEIVTLEDAERSIKLIHYFLDKVLGREGQTVWDIDTIATGTSARTKDAMHMVKEAIREYVAERGMAITKGELVGKLAGQVSETDMLRMLEKLKSQGDVYSPRHDVYDLAE
jgi:replicative DNA helicase Mcm